MKASLIIPTYNKLPRLKLVIASIVGQKCDKDAFQVIFTNDGSTDGTEDFFKNSSFPFNYIYINTQNSGRANARNAAIKRATNEILIFVDDDVVLHPAFISEHLKEQRKAFKVIHGRINTLTYLKFFEDPTRGIFYSNMKNSKPSEGLRKMCLSESDILNNFEERFSRSNKVTFFESAIEKLLTKYDSKADWVSFTSGNTSVPKEWLEDAGLFDENFGTRWGCEDLELGYRLYKKKKNFKYLKSAVNYHIAHYRNIFEDEHRIPISYFYETHKDEKILKLKDFIDGKIGVDKFVEEIL